MVRKRRKAQTLQQRVNEMWPTAVREALAEERRGETISKERQVYLMALIVAAIEAKQRETVPDVEGSWIEIRIIQGKLRAYRFSGDDAQGEYIGDVGEW